MRSRKNLVGCTEHPGIYIKRAVIPNHMSLYQAAEKLGIGSEALMDILEGKLNLSSEMAMRVEKSFGVSSDDLMEMQCSHLHGRKRAEQEIASLRAAGRLPPVEEKLIDEETLMGNRDQVAKLEVSRRRFRWSESEEYLENSRPKRERQFELSESKILLGIYIPLRDMLRELRDWLWSVNDE